MPKTWMIDERHYAGAEHLDPDYVAGYDRKAGYERAPGDAPGGITDHLDDLPVLQAHGLTASATLVDLGTGTGRLALAAAPLCARVIAADVSPAMLAVVGARAADAGLANVECVHAGFLGYEHTGAPADVVYTRNALHQLPDLWKAVALDRIARTLRPGGVLRLRDLVYDFAPAEADTVFDAWLAGAGDDPAAAYTAADLAEHIRTEFSTFRWLLEPMLEAAGFDIVDVAYSGRVFGAYTCVRR